MSNISVLQAEVDDDGKLRDRWYNKKGDAKTQGLKCLLTFEEYCQLVKDAGLVSSQLGYKGQKYVLARYNDEGNYEIGNCRFITQKENIKEKKISMKMHQENMRKVRLMHEKRKQMSPEEFSRRTSEGIRNSKSYQQKSIIRREKELERQRSLDPRWKGEKNSAYGCRWVTNGETNIFWNPKKGPMPEGFDFGRIYPTKLK